MSQREKYIKELTNTNMETTTLIDYKDNTGKIGAKQMRSLEK